MPSDAAIIYHQPREELARDLPASDSTVAESVLSTSAVVANETAPINPLEPKQQLTPRLQPALERVKMRMSSTVDIRGSITSESSFIVVHNTLKVAWERTHQSRGSKTKRRRRSVDGSVTTITPSSSTSDLSIATLGGDKQTGEVFGDEEGRRGSITPRLGVLKEQQRQRWRLSDMDIIERLSLT